MNKLIYILFLIMIGCNAVPDGKKNKDLKIQKVQKDSINMFKSRRYGQQELSSSYLIYKEKTERDIKNYKSFYKNPNNSFPFPEFIGIGKNILSNRIVEGIYEKTPLILYSKPDTSSDILMQDTQYVFDLASPADGEPYLDFTMWHVLYYSPEWIQIEYKGKIGWIEGKYFSSSKIVIYDIFGNKIKEFSSPFLNNTEIGMIITDDKLKYIYVSNWKEHFVEIETATNKIIDTMGYEYVSKKCSVPISSFMNYWCLPVEEINSFNQMRFLYGDFVGWFTKKKVYYIECYFSNNCDKQFVLSQDRSSNHVDTLFEINTSSGYISYQIEHIFVIEDKYILISMGASDKRY